MPASLVRLSDGTDVAVELSDVTLLQDAAGQDALPSLRELLEKVAKELKEALDAAKPSEASVKIGIKAAAGSGGVLKWVVGKLDAETTIEVTLKWVA